MLQTLVTTTLVGGLDGTIFEDVYVRFADGNISLRDDKCDEINLDYPMLKISVSSGVVVDGVAITYRLANGGSIVFTHGSSFAQTDDITFGETEKLVGVFGRSGQHPTFKRNLVINIGFVLYDNVQESVRVLGPYGTSGPSSPGKPFYCSNVLALGGFATTASHLGLCGLFFYKDVGRSESGISED